MGMGLNCEPPTSSAVLMLGLAADGIGTRTCSICRRDEERFSILGRQSHQAIQGDVSLTAEHTDTDQLTSQ